MAAVGLVLAALVLTLVIKKESPAIALLLALAAGLVLMAWVMGEVGGVLTRLEALLVQAGLTREWYLPISKAIGVAILVRVGAALCRDAGQTALAAKVELAGALIVLALCLPLIEQMLALTAGWMT